MPEVTKKHIFFKILHGGGPTGADGNLLDIIRKHQVVVFLSWTGKLCAPAVTS